MERGGGSAASQCRGGELLSTRKKKLSRINGPNPVKPNPLDYISSRLNGRFGLEFFIGEYLSTVIFFMLIPSAFLPFAQISPHLVVTLKVEKNRECCEC